MGGSVERSLLRDFVEILMLRAGGGSVSESQQETLDATIRARFMDQIKGRLEQFANRVVKPQAELTKALKNAAQKDPRSGGGTMNAFQPVSKAQFHKAFCIWLILIIVLPPNARAQSRTGLGTWNAMVVGASPSSQGKGASPGAKVSLEVGNETISLEQKNHMLFEIPASQVIETSYDNSSHRNMAVLDAATSPNITDTGGYSLARPLLIAGALTASFKTTKHYVRIFWKGADGPEEIMFEVGKNDYAPLLTQLQRVTGKPWNDLPQERQKVRREGNQGKGAKSR